MTANCPRCGRFCAATGVKEYNGNYTGYYVTTHCSRCGEITRNQV